jgi:hypothetical protein
MLHAMAMPGKQRSRTTAAGAPRMSPTESPVARMQSTYGNQAILRWLAGSKAPPGRLQRKCECGGTGEQCDCENKEKKEKEGLVQRKAAGRGPGSVPPVVHEVLRSPGQPLDAGTRAFMERRFGYDFGLVRVHTDSKAAESAKAVTALAYTVGRNVVFDSGTYAPQTTAGQKLLAHELAHVVQQGGANSVPLEVGAANCDAERQAASAASVAMTGGVFSGFHAQPARIARQATPERPTRAGEQAQAGATATPASAAGCTPAAGITSSTCSAYLENVWWLPLPYVNNATCACKTTPNVPTAMCVRKFLQDRLAATPTWLRAIAAAAKVYELTDPPKYQSFVQSALTPLIYQDHVDAYRACCCPSGPASYIDWIGVTNIAFQPCSLVGWFIKHFGSCTGTPGDW